jgi:uracil-DNA glycosylase
VSDEWNDERDERRALIRQVRQRLESLGRAGLVQIHASSNPKPTGPAKVVLQARASGAERDAGGVAAQSVEHRPGPVNAPVLPETTDSRRPASDKPVPVLPETKDKGQSTKDKPASVPLSKSSLFGELGFESPPVPAGERPAILAASAAEVSACRRCPHLASTRTQTVFGTGSPTARLMFIGEAPGADEDRTGQPFVGVAGQLLTDMITKGMGLSREEVYIANVLKCRPPGNRTPTTEEAANCSSYLDHQIAVIRPEFLCLLGKTAASALLDLPPTATMGPLRKRWHQYKGIRTLVTYHPSYLLRTQSAKKDAWEDLQILMKEMGIPVPRRK